MDKELQSFIKVWISVFISVTYCYYIPTRIKPRFLRLFSVLPICVFFILLPLFLSSTVHYSFITSLFLPGVANLKLILFCFDNGPLFPLPPNLLRFICFTCFPIKLQQNPNPQTHFPKLIFSIKVIIFSVLLHFYDHGENQPLILLFALYSLQLYLELEIFLTIFKALIGFTLGYDLDTQFNEPYLATSLQDFWGRRWNLMVTKILRQAVYIPVRRICDGRISSDLSRFLGVFASFVVSGVGHEVFFFTLTFEIPTGEVTLFFLLHGICTAVEVTVKRTRFAKPLVVRPAVSRVVTVWFVVVTGGLLFFPPLVRSNIMERRTNETLLFFDFVKRSFITLFGDFMAN